MAESRRNVAAATRRTAKKPRMKLAEALALRSDAQKRFEQLKQRLLRAAKVQEGDKPPENPAELMRELDAVGGELRSLIQRINRTNSSTELERGMSISDAIATRDVLRLSHIAYRDLAATAVVTQDRRTKSEVRFKGTVSVAAMQKKADQLAKAHRELDSRIQAANWEYELKD